MTALWGSLHTAPAARGGPPRQQRAWTWRPSATWRAGRRATTAYLFPYMLPTAADKRSLIVLLLI